MRIPLFLFFLLFSKTVCCQINDIDSNPHQLDNIKVIDTNLVDYLNRKARENIFISINESSKYASKALELSFKLNYKRGQAYAYRNLASLYSVQEYYYASSLFIEKSLNLFKELHDSVGLGNCYLTIGSTYFRQQKFKNAIEFYNDAIRIFRNKNLNERLGAGLYNLGESQMSAGDFNSAKSNTQKAISIFQNENELAALTACYRVMGIIYMKENRLDSAEIWLQKALDLSAGLGKKAQKEATVESLIYLAQIKQESKNFALSPVYLKRAIFLSKENGYKKPIKEAYLRLVDYYVSKKDTKWAQRTLQEYSLVNDSLLQLENNEKAKMVASLMESLQIASKNEQLLEQRVLQQQIIKSQRTEITISILFIAVLLLLLGILFHIYQQNKKLTETLATQNLIIEEKSEKLEELNITKDKFFNIVAHDLRSPLNSLQSFLSLFKEGLFSLPQEEIQSLVNELNNSIKNTLSLTNNLITWASSQMNKEQTSPDRCALNEIIQSIIALNKEKFERKEIKIFTNLSEENCPVIFADCDQVEFIIRNLVNNALKFTPRNGEVQILVKKESDFVIITIKDTGLGIPEKTIKNLFKLGKTTSTTGTEGEKGTGLGLVLCKEFAEKNGGTITVESILEKGTSFHVRLPSVN